MPQSVYQNVNAIETLDIVAGLLPPSRQPLFETFHESITGEGSVGKFFGAVAALRACSTRRRHEGVHLGASRGVPGRV
ncbi:hypothetical protein AB0M46_07080 [Dactylosporangium sp. NPDC051485]|uniref:hypothetical protein n=1 Tax=Dactylosporangium sp. NPDC051485 TaxID=3154846 RepID=UPI00341DF981